MQDQALDKLARRRAGAKLGWYIHALVFVLVNLLLAVLSASSGRNWAIFPALGWGLGLAIHGAVVYMVTGGMMDRMVEHERRQLARDPW
ncbi:MAG TPA: 2TM domain-containing protein [Ramlibacter sp.]|jgi:hypothetical protein|nr:2TM domain-containing protein [Ramlibacter sp.]